MIKEIFVNLPVKDLQVTMEFFKQLGFTFNPQFTDEKAACLILSENIYAMLLREEFFNSFIEKTGKTIADSNKTTEVINAISVESREKVDELCEKALQIGGKKYRDADDYGWMYSRSFQDPDGHLWEILYADMSKLPKKE